MRQLCNAIKLVYASTFSRSPKSYIRSTPYRIEEEQMAVIIQRLAARRHGDRCYPNFAGVAQSYNYYPVGRMKAEEGLAHVALGLGKTVVDGGTVLRFSPARPKRLIQFGSTRDILRNSQKQFYALDLSSPDARIEPDTDGPLVQLGLDVAERDGTLAPVGSVYVPGDGMIRDSIFHEGPRLVTFAHVLKAGMFPLADLLKELLSISRRSMGSEVELEFAVNLSAPESGPHEFSVLQCRPLVAGGEVTEVSLENIAPERVICYSEQSLGNGVIRDLHDVVFVSPQRWDNAHTMEIAREIGRINERLVAEERKAIFIGMGRWGTSDQFLGIPVLWGDISSAKVMVEVGTPQYRVEPSQGSHFFHNITSFRIGYLTVNTDGKGGRIDFSALRSGTLIEDLKHTQHVRFDNPLEVRLDGRGGHGAILLPRNQVMDAAMQTL
jgi:Pyruvate phosphate dikinase, AMP/ATP-binding domain